MMKKLAIAIIILICSLSFVYSFSPSERATSGNTDGRLYLIARNSMNNRNRAMNLNLASTYNTNTTGLGDTFDASTPAQALFRLIVSLYSEHQTTNPLYLKISSANGWCFVNESNPSYKRPFALNAFKYTSSLNNKNVYQNYTSAQAVTLSTTGDVSENGSGYYLLPIPYATKVTSYYYNYVFANPLTDIDLCISLPNDASQSLPAGYYYADLQYETVDASGNPVTYVEDKANNGDITVEGNKSLSGTFRVWGYIGNMESNSVSSYNFSVSETPNTYSMDLKSDSCYDVAKVVFSQVTVTDYAPSSTEQDNDKEKYKIYISPGEEYDLTTYTANNYCFKKLDTEGKTRTDENTVYYSLFKDESGTDSFSQFADHPYVYELIPDYDAVPLMEVETNKNHDMKKWTKTWSLNQTVYLQVTNTSLSKEHLKGLYSSYLYFTLVVQ